MSDPITLDAEKRERLGTNSVESLRDRGILPGVLYGNDQESIPVQVDYLELEKAIEASGRLYRLTIEGESQTAKIQDLQWDHLGEDVLHVDFERVNPDKPVQLRVPITTVGTSTIIEGRGAYMQRHLPSIEVSCPPDRIPEAIPVSIDGLSIGDVIHVEDVDFPEYVEPVTPGDRLIISVHEAREVLEEEEEEMGLEPTALEPELVGEEEEEEAEEEEDLEEEETEEESE